MWSNFAAANNDELAPHENTLSLGLTAGVFLPDSDVHDFYYATNTWQPLNPAAPAMGLRVSYEPFRYVGIEAEGEMIPIGVDDAMDDKGTIVGMRGQIVGELPKRLTPFVLLGGGTMGIISGDAVLGDDMDFTWHMGTGAKFFITPRWSIRLDGRWLLAPKHDVPGEDDNLVSHFLVNTALTWRFGDEPRVEPPNLDPDHDGVLGDADKCAFDAGVAPDGCPAVADADHDDIPDAVDQCPAEAETVNQVDDQDGCPDKEPDKDGDRLADRADACPDAAEDMDGFQDEDGCPDADNDNDGLPDPKDLCALAPGPTENQGCPDKDTDGDGLVDRLDNCPADTGWAQYSGCRSKQLVVITQTEIKVLDKIYFGSRKMTIRTRSNALLDNLAQVLNAHPEVTRVYVEGHTDDRGDPARNKDLSQGRAMAVVEYLVRRGVSTDRLEPIGRGSERPLVDNSTAAGRSQNRRVEFRIDRKPIAAATP